MFVDYLVSNGFICHDRNEIHIDENRLIFCKVCKNLILDVNKHLTVETLPILSSFLAKQYANMTGDLNVPCRIVIKDIPGIEPRYVETSYFNLVNAIELLGTVNQDFILCKNHRFDVNVTLKNKILENFISYYMTMVDSIVYEKEEIGNMIKAILNQMKDTFDSKEYNIFEFYRNIICPYVKTLDSTVREEEVVDFVCPGEFFVHLSNNATIIRNQFSKYCLSFDIMYNMIYCFACHKDLDLVANFVFNMIWRLCNDYFDAVTPYQVKCRNIVDSFAKSCKDQKLYYLVSDLKKGLAVDIFSFQFYNKFAFLQQEIYKKFCKAVSTPSEAITRFAFSQSFPFVLFPNTANYYGFMCMMGFATNKLNLKHNADFEKRTCANARLIIQFIESYIQKIKTFGNGTFMKVSEMKRNATGDNGYRISEFVQNNQLDIDFLQEDQLICLKPPVEYWTLDVFKLFIGNDEGFMTHLMEFLHLLGVA